MVAALTEFISTHGYWAIALLMFAENIFPPLPSELIMPFAGFVAARGELHPACSSSVSEVRFGAALMSAMGPNSDLNRTQ